MAGYWFENKHLNGFLDFVQKVAVVVGIPIGVYSFWVNKGVERYEAELATYEKLDDRYWQYQRLCMDNPTLDVSDVSAEDKELGKVLKDRAKLTVEEKVKERQILSLFYSMCERAFLLYSDKSTEFKARQWTGWDKWIRSLVKRPSFREAWQAGDGYDTQFSAYVNRILATRDGEIGPR